jgi:4-amino-4-deoxy-L-arabinose transferase-like glycosyltransferase
LSLQSNSWSTRLSRVQATRLILITFVLLLVAGQRIANITTFEMHHDEVWSVWQTFGTPAQIVHWTPFDWAPLYYLLLGAWRLTVGIHPIVLRWLSILLSLITAALMYRLGARISRSHNGGLISLLVYASLGFGVYQSIVVRGYALLVMCGALAFLLMLDYFEKPTTRRGLILGVALAIMLYTHFSAVFAFLAMGIYTLFTMRKRVLRWVLPVCVLVVLNIPQIPTQLDFLARTNSYVAKADPVPLVQNLVTLFNDYAGEFPIVLFVVTLLATVANGLSGANTRTRRPALAAFILWLTVPVWVYISPRAVRLFTDPVSGTYIARYLWWCILPLALWCASGISLTPRTVLRGVTVLLLGTLFLQVPARYQENVPPFMANFSLLAHELQWGDVIVIDPNIPDEGAYQWQYFADAYTPNQVRIVSSPTEHRRVWYVSVNVGQDPDLVDVLNTRYVPGKFFGPWNFLFRLYEAPPDPEGILFENGMRFHGIDILGSPDPTVTAFRDGETIRLRLWWSVDQPPQLDYSVGVYLFDDQYRLRAESNSSPAVPNAPTETSRWLTDHFYIEERDFSLPTGANTGTYTLYLSVYQWWDNQRVTAESTNSDGLLPLRQFLIKTWKLS